MYSTFKIICKSLPFLISPFKYTGCCLKAIPYSRTTVLELQHALESPGRTAEAQIAESLTQALSFCGSRVRPEMCMCSKLPGDAGAAGPGTTLRSTSPDKEQLLKKERKFRNLLFQFTSPPVVWLWGVEFPRTWRQHLGDEYRKVEFE